MQRKYKRFTIVAVSKNRNAFGLNNYVFIANDGEAASALANKDYQRYQHGDTMLLPQGNTTMGLARLGFECPRSIANAPAQVVAECGIK